MDIVNKALDEIIPYAKNAKKHDKRQIANVAESIRQYGFVQPVVIDRDGVIVIGHSTQKPVGLIAEILKDFSSENQVIIDCFGGSGRC